jgi:hypothetical protein
LAPPLASSPLVSAYEFKQARNTRACFFGKQRCVGYSSAIAYDDDHVFARYRRALFRLNRWRAHSWRVQVAIASFKPKNITEKDHTSKATN